MVDLFEQNIKTMDRQSSKGNQLKWQNENTWYKADYLGYEGMAEYVISHLLRYSSLQADEYVLYEPEVIRYNNILYQGVKSEHFLKEDWQIITLERLFQNFYGQSLHGAIYRIQGVEARLEFLVKQVERITGLRDFGIYMSKLFTIDALFLNEDRHTHNIAVLMNGAGEFKLCPFFDHGAGLLSDTSMDYPMGVDIYQIVQTVKAKTICDSFEEQLDAAEKMYGQKIKFDFTYKDVEEIINRNDNYDDKIKARMIDIVRVQINKYRYLFKSKNIQ